MFLALTALRKEGKSERHMKNDFTGWKWFVCVCVHETGRALRAAEYFMRSNRWRCVCVRVCLCEHYVCVCIHTMLY